MNRYRLPLACLSAVLLACADPAPLVDRTTPAEAPAFRPKADTADASAGVIPPPFDTLGRPALRPDGFPLWVSNNPEHVAAPGLLLDAAPDAPDAVRRPTGDGAPAARWLDEGGATARTSTEQGCSDGGLRRFSLYLAHILGRSIPAPRRLAVELVLTDADADAAEVVATARGDVGTSGWSKAGAPATRRTDWLGAVIAKRSFFGTPPVRTARLAHGRAAQLFEIEAGPEHLVEGRLEIRVEGGCARPRVGVRGGGGVAPFEAGRWAAGDVKWPGWSQGQGYGRAAGLYRADAVAGEDEVRFEVPGRTEGRALLTAGQSVGSLGRLADSADVLFGNYGVLHRLRFTLSNPTGTCLDVTASLAAYADRGPGFTASGRVVPRAPTYAYLSATAQAYRPTMIWNGPVAARLADGPNRLFHPVLFPEATDRDRTAPTTAMDRLHAQLGTLRLEPGARATADLEIPIPGYITAPLGVLFSPATCSP